MRRGIATIGLVALLVLDIVLVFFALRPSAPVVPLGAAKTPSSAPARDTSTGFAKTEEPAQTEMPRPLAIVISAIGPEVAWRAEVGSCSKGGASLETTTDGGKTWDEVKAPAPVITRVQPLEANRGFVVGGENCRFGEFTTTDGGQNWDGPQALVGGWARRTDKVNEVITPQQQASRPCGDDPIIDLSRTSAESAEALCQDGAVKVTGDGGKSWLDSGEAPGAFALSNRLESRVLTTYAVMLADGCDGVAIVQVAKGKDATEVACIETKSEVEAGRVAISVSADSGWVLIGDETWTAGTDLDSWTRA
jgi:photosystem II stability/assembly factor-like uncharacterized protein